MIDCHLKGLWAIFSCDIARVKKEENFMIKGLYIILVLVMAGFIVYQNQLLSKVTKEAKKSESVAIVEKMTFPNAIDTLAEVVEQKLNKDAAQTANILNQYFNEEFFKISKEPFKELNEFHNKIMSTFDQGMLDIFNRSWEQWYRQRFDMTGIKSTISENKDNVVVRYKFPNVDNRNVKVKINGNSIVLVYSIKKVAHKENETSTPRQEYYKKIVPIPAHADVSKPLIETQVNELTIIFPKKMPHKG